MLFRSWDLKHPQHQLTLDHPELYDFADVSQNNHNENQTHWDNLQWVRRDVSVRPRPLNMVKIYGADTGEYGTTRDGIERFWRAVIGGTASARFHRPTSGIGLSTPARAHIASARSLTEAFDLFSARPDTASTLLSEREPDEAYLTRVPGEAYAVYFPEGGRVELDLSAVDGTFDLRWLDADREAWSDARTVETGSAIVLEAPSEAHDVALLSR